MPNLFDWKQFARQPLVGILRGFTSSAAVSAVRAAADGGLTTFEVTLNTAGAAQQIKQLSAELGTRVNIGAGTVCTADDVQLAVASGATFIVTPVVEASVIAACQKAHVPAFVGAMTPTEIFQAWRLGATLVKLFPADVLGPAYLQSIRGPLAEILLMPTGGVTVESLVDYHRAGATAFGIGGPLFDKQRIAAGDWAWVETQARRFAAAFEASTAALGQEAEARRKQLAARSG